MKVSLIINWIKRHDPKGSTKLAAAADWSPGLVHQVVKKGHVPKVEFAIRMAQVLGVSLDELCSDDPRNKQY